MKTIILSLLLLVGTNQLLGQELNKADLIGSWKAVDVQLIGEIQGIDEDGKQMIEQMREGFVGTIFGFKANDEFTIQFKESIPPFMKELEFLNNKNWKIENGTVLIGTPEDGFSLMGIIVMKREGKNYFLLEETTLILEVSKQ